MCLRIAWALLLCATTAAAAPSPSVRLQYSRAAEQCPDESMVRVAVANCLGYDPFSDEAARSVEVTVRRGERGLRARIQVREADGHVSGERELVTHRSDCVQLALAVELAVSLAIDPHSLAGAPVAPAPPAPPPIPAAVAPPPAPPTVVATPPPRAPRPIAGRASTHGRGGVKLFGAVGSVPSGTLGLALTLGVRRPRWSIDLEARADLQGSGNRGRVLTGIYGGSLVPCLHHRWLALCEVTTIGSIFGHGEGDNVQSTSPFVALGARPGFELPLTSVLELQAHLDLLFNVLRPTLATTPDPIQAPLFTAQLGVGIAGYFR